MFLVILSIENIKYTSYNLNIIFPSIFLYYYIFILFFPPIEIFKKTLSELDDILYVKKLYIFYLLFIIRFYFYSNFFGVFYCILPFIFWFLNDLLWKNRKKMVNYWDKCNYFRFIKFPLNFPFFYHILHYSFYIFI